MRRTAYDADFCVVGGGLAGMIAAIAAARRGAKVVLVQDRPVLGGNASSEIRMHVCGANGENVRETGILEELMLDNLYHNSTPTYALWDAVLYAKAQYQENLTLLLNCTVNRVTITDDWRASVLASRIKAIHGYQLTTETEITVTAPLFADCSGDGVLAPLTGADYRMGREGRDEFGEGIAPPVADTKTMGMTCLLQAREHDTPQPFAPFAWAHTYRSEADLRGRGARIHRTNFWWMEVGGEWDSIHDTERCREELLKIAFGVWDYMKNHAPDKALYANFALDWQGFLPGKRESRRYCGDHILTQHDIEAAGCFDDIVAYGGWTMDDHFPAGFYHPEAGTIFHPAPSPFGIPYRSLYSRNVANLFCAGRCHSATHSAMSATRVMGTTSLMGQAVGTAAAIATRHHLTPRAVYEQKIPELQAALMDDDCWLPGHRRAIPEPCRSALLAAATGNVEALRSGMDRGGEYWEAPLGIAVTYAFDAPVTLREIRLVCDSDLDRTDPSRGNGTLRNMRFYAAKGDTPFHPPSTLLRAFRLEGLSPDGTWHTLHRTTDNFQRLVRISPVVSGQWPVVSAIRLIPEATWGHPLARLFAFDCTQACPSG
ncbi:MAG: FAD-dependent oxidoreductase, partial [Kiritimatiellaeota bacterium]|nr:FAD-dependent oxidoreductase [Kiritimatiellota bacterium]